MKLIFNNSGSTSELSSWAKQFKEITTSTLMEIDLQAQELICKVSTEDKGLVRYSSISFEKCGLTYVDCLNNTGEQEIPDSRIMAGIFLILPKFITVVDVFDGAEHSLTINFDLNQDTGRYEALDFTFKSKTLRMTVPCSNAGDFKEISDDVFYNKVYVANDPVTVEVTTDFIKNLMGISLVFSTDPMQDVLKFFTKYDNTENKWQLCVSDKNGKYFSYVVGYLKEDLPADALSIEMQVFRSKFAMAAAKSPVDLVIKVSKTDPNRILLEAVDQSTKTVISTTRG